MGRYNVSELSFSVALSFVVLGLATLEAEPPSENLLLHLKADAGVQVDANGRLLVWEDQAGGDHDATPSVDDPEVMPRGFGTSEPQLSCATFPNGEHTVLGFQGDAGLAFENEDEFDVPEVSIYAVVGLSTSRGMIMANYSRAINWGYGYVCRFNGLGLVQFVTSNGTQESYNWPDERPIAGASPGDKHYLSFHASNANTDKQIYVDGALHFSKSGLVADHMGYFTDNEPSIGSLQRTDILDGTSVEFYDGPIAEILLYTSVSEAQREAVEDYLQEKYGFPGQPPATPPALSPLPPTLLACAPNFANPGSVDLTWKVCGAYTQQRVLRDGSPIATLSGSQESYSDLSPLGGLHTYQIEATIGGAIDLSEECEADFFIPAGQGRILHLAADQGVTSDVQGVLTWEDQSPVGGDNSAVHEPSFGSAFARHACDTLPNGLHNVIQFEDPVGAGDLTGAGMSFLNPEALEPETRSVSLYAVVEIGEFRSGTIFSNYSQIAGFGSGFSLFFDDDFNNNRVCFQTSAATAETWHDHCAPGDEALLDGWHLITATVDFFNGTKRVYVDGVLSAFWDFDQSPDADECLDGDTAPNDLCYVGNSMSFAGDSIPAIGSYRELPDPQGSHRYHNGGLAELILYDSVSEDQRLMVEAELRAKYFEGVSMASCDLGGGAQLAGDCNQDGTIDLSDVICLLGHLFQGNPEQLPCGTAAANLAFMDCNEDGGIDLSDAIYKLAFLFQGGPGPIQGPGCLTIPDCPDNTGCL